MYLWLLPFLVTAAEGTKSTATETIAGGAGWVGAGLLGSVLAWLLFIHIPTKDKQAKEKDELFAKSVKDKDESHNAMTERQQQRMEKLMLDHAASLEKADKERRQDFSEALSRSLEHCQRETAMLRDMLGREMSEVSGVVVDLRKSLEDWREERLLRNTPRGSK